MDGFNNNVTEINKCIVLNKTVQHLLSDILKSIKEEMTHLTEQEHELLANCSLPSVPEGYLRRPFLKLRSGECPPPNIDAVARQQRKEYNLSEVRALFLKNLLKSEWMSVIKSVARCTLEKKIEKLDCKREALLCKLSTLTSLHTRSCTEKEGVQKLKTTTSEVLSDLRETENLLLQFRSMRGAPSKWLTSAMATAALSKKCADRYMDSKKHELWEKRIYRRYHGAKFKREYAAQTWVSLLSEAEEHLTGAEWAEISIHTFENSISPTNIQLAWHHRVRPGLNTTDWTKEEDQKLKSLVTRFGQHGRWEEIADELNTGRTAFLCLQRWQMALNPEFAVNRPWTGEEDTALMDILKKLLEVYPPSLIDWEVVEAFHTTRTASECRIHAPAICSSFPRSFTLEAVELPVVSRAQPVNNVTNLKPFSAAEDLQLLMAVQRYGNASGRGAGGGVGTGSWAVICSALPGRSVAACRSRYYELCVQFQPWTYAEDRRLYRLVLEGMDYDSETDLTPYYRLSRYRNLLPQFPGRSLNALKQRCLLLIRWSKVWKSLRHLVSSVTGDTKEQIVGTNSHIQGAFNESAEHSALAELRRLLIYSPFATQFISQLRGSGVSDPEAEAFKLLTTWTTHEPHSTNDDSEFAQLLTDLSSGLLIPRPLVSHGTESSVGVQAHTANPPEGGSSTEPLESAKQFSLLDAKRLVNYAKIKQLLAGPVRRSLFCLVVRTTKVSTHERTQWRKQIEDSRFRAHMEQLLADPHQRLESSRERVAVAKKLLNDDQLFWLALDQTLKLPSLSGLLQQLQKVAHLHFLAPFIARRMTRSEEPSPSAKRTRTKRKPLAKATDPRTTAQHPVEQDESCFPFNLLQQHLPCDNEPLPTRDSQPSNTVERITPISVFRRNKLVLIKRLLHMYGRRRRGRANAYALVSTKWTSKATVLTDANRLHNRDQYVPPILQSLPPWFASRLYQNPDLISVHCSNAAQGCVRHGLSLNLVSKSFSKELSAESTESLPQPGPSTALPSRTPDKSLAKLLPPSYSTLLAFKSLMIRLPQLIHRGGNCMTQIASIRETLQNTEANRTEPGSSAATTSDSSPLKNYYPNIVRIVQSDAHRRFLAVGLSILLWPALLSTLPASTIVQSGKRFWEEALAQIPEDVLAHIPPGIPAKVPRMAESDDESIPDDPMLVLPEPPTENRRQTTSQSRIQNRTLSAWSTFKKGRQLYRRTTMLKSSTVSFKMSIEDKDFYLTLPAGIKRLFASGFRPESVMFAPK